MNYEQIARIAHEVNRAFCASLDDHSQVAWEDAPEWQRASAIEGVKANALDDLTPEQNHAAWCAHKVREGWDYGPVKDAELRKHPCLVPYDFLPSAQQTKDHLYRAVVRTALDCGGPQ